MSLHGSQAGWFAISATSFAIALPVSFWLTQRVPFDAFLIVWEVRQVVYLGCYYLLLSVPFFAAATAIGLALTSESEKCPRLYAYNMVGSGAGALLAVVLLSIARVEWALVGVMGLAQGAAVAALLDEKLSLDRGSPDPCRRWRCDHGNHDALRLVHRVASQYKGLSYAPFLTPVVADSPCGRVTSLSRPTIQKPGSFLSRQQITSPPWQPGSTWTGSAAITAFGAAHTAISRRMIWRLLMSLSGFAPGLACRVLGAGRGAGVCWRCGTRARQVDAVELGPTCRSW
jgi:hypothetical protein